MGSDVPPGPSQCWLCHSAQGWMWTEGRKKSALEKRVPAAGERVGVLLCFGVLIPLAPAAAGSVGITEACVAPSPLADAAAAATSCQAMSTNRVLPVPPGMTSDPGSSTSWPAGQGRLQ